jgi:CHAT domain-containing protein/Tfp pilus assembly protein PilF
MNTTKLLCCLLGSMLLAATLPLIQAQTTKDQPGTKAKDQEKAVDVKPTKITGELKRDDPLDDKRKHPCKVHEFKMGQGQSFVIRLKSSDFDAFLIVRDSNNKELAFNDDDPDDTPTTNSKLVFTAPKEDTYKIVVTSDDNKVGKYELTIEAASKDQVLTAKATQTAQALYFEGVQLYESGKLKESASKLTAALEIRKKLYAKERYPQGHPELVLSLNDLGAVLLAQGAYAKAEPYFREALAMRQALFPKDRYPQGHPDVAQSLNNLGESLREQGEYAKAEPYFRDALAMWQAVYPVDRYPKGHPALGLGLNNLGLLLKSQGDFAKAEPYYRDALAMLRALYPQGHPDLALSLNNLAVLLRFQGENAKAELYFREALAMLKALYPQGHAILAGSLSNLGALLQAQGEYAKAEPYYRDALVMRQALYPKDRYTQGHPHLALSLNDLGLLFQAHGNYAKAEPYLRDALAMQQALYPKDRYPLGHPELAESLNNLGTMLGWQGDYAKAEQYFGEAVTMYQALYRRVWYPQGHLQLATSLNNLGGVLMAQGEYAKAEPYTRDALAMLQFHFDRLAEAAAEAQALNFAAHLPAMLDDFLSIQRRLPEDAAAYGLVWKSRSPLTRIQQRRHLDLYSSQNPAAKNLALELQNARQRLAHLLLSPATDAAEHKRNLDQLTDAKEDLEKRLARQLNLNLPAASVASSPQQLSKSLPEGAAFIDVVRYTDFTRDPKVPGKKGHVWIPRFVAFVVLNGKPALRVDLGLANSIEKAWTTWREAIVSNRPDRQAAAALAALVWQPLRQHLPAKTHTVWLAADGQLAQVPWAALPGDLPNTILLEELAVAVVPHGAFLLQLLQDKPPGPEAKATFLAVGGVAYEKAPAAVTGVTQIDLRLAPIPADRLVTWKALPGTASELAQIAGLARKALKTEPVVLKGDGAGIAQVSAELPKVRFAHLATHGFFADLKFRSAFQVDEKQFEHFGLERKTAGARSPLVLSGLVLSGANRPDTPQRGILTAEAIVSQRLEDLELAVLSACETGLGETAGGEGVYGLQRAFHVAGARNVIASLWRVDDDATAALMVVFYHKLWLEKLAPLQALREAQLHIYRHPEEIKGLAALRSIDFNAKDLPKVTPTPLAKDARAHTSQWAAFVLSGTGK